MSFVEEFFKEYRFEFAIAFPILALALSLIFWGSLPNFYYDLIWIKPSFLCIDFFAIILFILGSPVRFYLLKFQNTIDIIEPNDLELNKGETQFYLIKVVFGKRMLINLKNSKKRNSKYEIIVEKPDFIWMKPNDFLPGQKWNDDDQTKCKLICNYNREKELSIVFQILSKLSHSEIQPDLNCEIVFSFKSDNFKEKEVFIKDVTVSNS